jgi:molecular chaperone GrpE
MMPARKHATHHESDEQGAANAAPPPQAEGDTEAAAQPQAEATTNTTASAQDQGGMEDVQVLWRKKETSTGSAPAEATAEPTTAGGAATSVEEAADWEARFKDEQAKADDYFAKWQRAAADLANMRRRHEQERQEYMKQANAMLIAELLPVLDSFDRALASMPPELRELTWIDGIVLVERQLRMVLERAGLQPIAAEGQPFNPSEHEALLHEESDKPEDTVIGELQKGYKLYDRVLRPALVKVAKK